MKATFTLWNNMRQQYWSEWEKLCMLCQDCKIGKYFFFCTFNKILVKSYDSKKNCIYKNNTFINSASCSKCITIFEYLQCSSLDFIDIWSLRFFRLRTTFILCLLIFPISLLSYKKLIYQINIIAFDRGKHRERGEWMGRRSHIKCCMKIFNTHRKLSL